MIQTDTAPPPSSVRLGDLDISYHEIGSGPPLLMLHGTGPGASGWSNFRLTAPAFADGYRVIVPDLPRYGRSSKVPITGPRLTVLSGIIADFCEAVGVSGANIIGNSMGGQVGMKLAIDRPELVRRLTVIGSPPLGPSAMGPSPAEAIRLIEGYYRGSGPSIEKMRQLLTTLVYDPSFVTDQVVRDRYEQSVTPETIAANKGPLWEKETLEGQLGRLVAPVLVVWGQDDRAAPLDIALRMVRELPDARLLVFSRCGHWAQVEREVEFNRAVRSFFELEP
ncbi:MAG TPA: alpha/beta fold hydrolase [Candidatus Limnocylindrales bacterium]|nr:alpha/beta fold hydrolase [Candidatus Limnocylindrales bacterium]